MLKLTREQLAAIDDNDQLPEHGRQKLAEGWGAGEVDAAVITLRHVMVSEVDHELDPLVPTGSILVDFTWAVDFGETGGDLAYRLAIIDPRGRIVLADQGSVADA